MELTRKQIKMIKGIAILLMLLLHLFCTKSYEGLFTPLIMIGDIPLIYYIGLFGDCCVAIYSFCSGYGLLLNYDQAQKDYIRHNLKRLLKLYINYWIILIIFVVILGTLLGRGDQYPGSLNTFILSFLGVANDYNGAWWYLATYIILVLLSPITHKVVKRYNPIGICIVSLGIYLVSYLQRIKGIIIVDNEIIAWLLRQVALWGTSLFPFIMGSLFAEKKWFTWIFKRFNEIRFKNIIIILVIVGMGVAHGFIETLFIAPFIGIGLIILFHLLDKPVPISNLLVLLGEHSTNIWLSHMFFCSIYFKTQMYALKYPILIYIGLVVICLITSYIIQWLYKWILKKSPISIYT